jgi:hypothetical protein
MMIVAVMVVIVLRAVLLRAVVLRAHGECVAEIGMGGNRSLSTGAGLLTRLRHKSRV